MDAKTAFMAEQRVGFAMCGPRAHAIVRNDPRDMLTDNERRQIELFRRFLQGERSHEVVAWVYGEPMSSANDPTTLGMGC